jgi:hypothetical protein
MERAIKFFRKGWKSAFDKPNNDVFAELLHAAD